MKLAYLIRDKLPGYTGYAHLYRMVPPLEDYEHTPHEYVVISSTISYTGPETYIFPASSEGEITDYAALPGSRKGTLNHLDVLSELEYILVTGEQESDMPKRNSVETWPETWPVIGSKGTEYTVGRKHDGTWGCTCQGWITQKKEHWVPVNGILQRIDCRHILQKKMELMQVGVNLKENITPGKTKVEDITKMKRAINLD